MVKLAGCRREKRNSLRKIESCNDIDQLTASYGVQNILKRGFMLMMT